MRVVNTTCQKLLSYVCVNFNDDINFLVRALSLYPCLMLNNNLKKGFRLFRTEILCFVVGMVMINNASSETQCKCHSRRIL